MVIVSFHLCWLAGLAGVIYAFVSKRTFNIQIFRWGRFSRELKWSLWDDRFSLLTASAHRGWLFWLLRNDERWRVAGVDITFSSLIILMKSVIWLCCWELSASSVALLLFWALLLRGFGHFHRSTLIVAIFCFLQNKDAMIIYRFVYGCACAKKIGHW